MQLSKGEVAPTPGRTIYRKILQLSLVGDDLAGDAFVNVGWDNLAAHQIILSLVGPVFDDRRSTRWADTGKLVEVLG